MTLEMIQSNETFSKNAKNQEIKKIKKHQKGVGKAAVKTS